MAHFTVFVLIAFVTPPPRFLNNNTHRGAALRHCWSRQQILNRSQFSAVEQVSLTVDKNWFDEALQKAWLEKILRR